MVTTEGANGGRPPGPRGSLWRVDRVVEDGVPAAQAAVRIIDPQPPVGESVAAVAVLDLKLAQAAVVLYRCFIASDGPRASTTREVVEVRGLTSVAAGCSAQLGAGRARRCLDIVRAVAVAASGPWRARDATTAAVEVVAREIGAVVNAGSEAGPALQDAVDTRANVPTGAAVR